jgi:hypothetical protein
MRPIERFLTCQVFALIVCFLGGAGCVSDKSGTFIPAPIQEASSRQDALRQARQLDLPTVAKANRLVLTDSSGQVYEIFSRQRIDQFIQALDRIERPPPQYSRKWIVTFYIDNTQLREIWVGQDGSWGFARPGNSWQIGTSESLPFLIGVEISGDTDF